MRKRILFPSLATLLLAQVAGAESSPIAMGFSRSAGGSSSYCEGSINSDKDYGSPVSDSKDDSANPAAGKELALKAD